MWKRKCADVLTALGSWPPIKGISTIKNIRGARNLDLGAPLQSITLERADGHQFMVMEHGYVFFLLRTIAGLELNKATDIYHPHGDKGEDQPV